MNTLIQILSPDFLLRNAIYTSVLVGFACPLVGVFLVTVVSELLRNLERGFSIGFATVPPLYGASQVVMAVVLILIIVYRPGGLLGESETSLTALVGSLKAIGRRPAAGTKG